MDQSANFHSAHLRLVLFIDTIQRIYSGNQLTGFYIMKTLVLNYSHAISAIDLYVQSLCCVYGYIYALDNYFQYI